MANPISIQPMTPSIGAEISGADLNQLDDTSFEKIQNAWQTHKLIVIRGQTFELEELCCFSRRFGELMQLPYIKPMDGFPDVIRVLKEADEINMGVFGGDWHSDFSFLPQAAN